MKTFTWTTKNGLNTIELFFYGKKTAVFTIGELQVEMNKKIRDDLADWGYVEA